MDSCPKPAKLANPRYISLFIINMIINIGFYMVSGTMSLHIKSLGISIADTGTIVGAMSIAAMVARPFSGWISDVMNRKLVFFLSLLFICASMFGYGFARTTAEFLMLRIVHGIAFGICTTVLMALIAGYIPEGRLGEGMGYFGLGQTLAVAVGPVIGLSIGNKFGFSLTFFLSGGFLAAAMVFALLTAGPEGASDVKKVSIRDTLRPDRFFAKEALLFGVFSIAISSVNGLEGSLLTLFGKQLGMDNIGWYFTISAAVMFISRLIFGKVMDKKGFAVIFYPGMAIIAASMIVLSQAAHSGAVAAFAVAAILKSLGVGAILPALQAECIKAVQPDKRGAASSTFFFGADIGQGTSPIIGGAIAQSYGYSSAFFAYMLPIVAVAAIYGGIKGVKRIKNRPQAESRN